MPSSAAHSAGNECAPSPILDLDCCQAIGPDGHRVDIAPQQFTLLYALASLPPGHVLSYRAAVSVVYGAPAAADWYAYKEALWSLTHRLNATLRAAGWPTPPVRAARGHGLKLTVHATTTKRQPQVSETTIATPATAVY